MICSNALSGGTASAIVPSAMWAFAARRWVRTIASTDSAKMRPTRAQRFLRARAVAVIEVCQAVGGIAAGAALYELLRRSPGLSVAIGAGLALLGLIAGLFAFQIIIGPAITPGSMLQVLRCLLTTVGITMIVLGLWRPSG